MNFDIELTEQEKMMNKLEEENKIDFENDSIFADENIYDLEPDEDIDEQQGGCEYE
ncbi:MAG: hypothetical protein ACOXZW_00315 [Bacilli bacterium]|jgi:hypothetical protein|nr:hypothetical protein [Bacilli bacterium]